MRPTRGRASRTGAAWNVDDYPVQPHTTVWEKEMQLPQSRADLRLVSHCEGVFCACSGLSQRQQKHTTPCPKPIGILSTLTTIHPS